MLETVYYAGNMPPWYRFALNCSTLVGAMFGQIVLGVLADKLGRKKVYGLELLLVIMASIGFAASAAGVNDSMSIIGWLTFWRFYMGCGIGADVGAIHGFVLISVVYYQLRRIRWGPYSSLQIEKTC